MVKFTKMESVYYLFYNFNPMKKHILPFSLDKRLRVQHLTLGEIIEPVSQQQLQAEVRPGKWTAFENAAHIAAFHDVYTKRIERMLREEAPAFEPYVWQKDDVFTTFKSMSKEALLERYVQDRNSLIALVDAIPEEDMQRTGIHGVYGQFSIAQWLEMFVLHEAHHLFTIFQLIHVKQA